jgi:hypothetical protein
MFHSEFKGERLGWHYEHVLRVLKDSLKGFKK